MQKDDLGGDAGPKTNLRAERPEPQFIGDARAVDWLQEARDKAAGVVLNAGAYTHTSVALHDAIKAIGVPVIETHLSNPAAREEFRHVSLVGQAAKGVIAGFGATSYLLAIEAAALLANEGQNA